MRTGRGFAVCGLFKSTGFVVAAALSVLGWAERGQAQTPADVPATVELVSLHRAVAPGGSVLLGVLITPESGWHTYWINPGDSGLATTVDWDLPEDYVAGPIQWPYPHYFETGGIAGFGYEGKVLLPVAVEAPGGISDPSVTFRATVKILVCREGCIPGKFDVEVTLPVASDAEAAGEDAAQRRLDPKHKALFDQAIADQPVELEAGRVSATTDGKTVTLLVRGINVSVARYFPVLESEIDAGARQQVKRTKDGLSITLKPSPYHDGPIDRLIGVLVLGPGQRDVEHGSLDVSEDVAQDMPAEVSPKAPPESSPTALSIDTLVEQVEP